MLPLLTAAAAEGKICGVVIPEIGIRSEPNKAAIKNRAVIEGRVNEARLVTMSNSPGPSVQRMDNYFNLEKVFHI
jgi:hypothetical protein